ncbi:MAG: Omp28-related outer membrane protein [Porphyromonas sp.]|nr:Omp28-related outer membrane protein [Porphyromonas sp.]
MSHTQIITSALITGLLILCACSKTEPQEPSKIEIPASDPKKPSTDTPPAEGDKPKDTPPAEGDKPKDTPPAEDKPKDTPPSIESKARIIEHKYLLTELVGQRCPTCHSFLVAFKSQKEREKDLVALITMHPSSRLSDDLYSSDAYSYLRAFQYNSVPQVVFNNLQGNRESTDDMIRRPDAIELKANLKLSGRELELELQTKLRAGQEGRVQGRQLKLLVWAIEDDVVAPQVKSNGDWIHNYEYDGLFRGSLNGLWGDDHTLGSILRGKYTLPNKLSRADKSYLLVLVSDANSHEVLDVTSLPLVGH